MKKKRIAHRELRRKISNAEEKPGEYIDPETRRNEDGLQWPGNILYLYDAPVDFKYIP